MQAMFAQLPDLASEVLLTLLPDKDFVKLFLLKKNFGDAAQNMFHCQQRFAEADKQISLVGDFRDSWIAARGHRRPVTRSQFAVRTAKEGRSRQPSWKKGGYVCFVDPYSHTSMFRSQESIKVNRMISTLRSSVKQCSIGVRFIFWEFSAAHISLLEAAVRKVDDLTSTPELWYLPDSNNCKPCFRLFSLSVDFKNL